MTLFLIGIGGTGMRCLEAFTNMCAVGMLENNDINILSLDTDHQNGNKSQAESVIENYVRIKSIHGEAAAYKDTFFSAKINLYKFAPIYGRTNANFAMVSSLSASTRNEQKRQNKDLADLLFDDDVQQFNLEHGYRAQTHIGSHLMYHAILAEIIKSKRGIKGGPKPDGIYSFIDKLIKSANLANKKDPVKVFIFGSIFGGTGASSIPVIPKALQKSAEIMNENLVLDNVFFGSTLLSDYFTFNTPKDEQTKKEKVIANASKFALNSKAALMFYEADNTVRETYKRMYHIGWSRTPVDYTKKEQVIGEVITGGGEQKNTAHVVELMSAFAAMDFFDTEFSSHSELEITYRTIRKENDFFAFTFADFVGVKDDTVRLKFVNKIAAFYAMCLMLNIGFEGKLDNLIKNISKRGKYAIKAYDNISPENLEPINQYLQAFSYRYIDGKIQKGWIHHIKKTVDSGNEFLFNNESFSDNAKDLNKFNWGTLLEDEKHHFGKRKVFKDNPFDDFIKVFKNKAPDKTVNQSTEKLLKHIYTTFTELHKI